MKQTVVIYTRVSTDKQTTDSNLHRSGSIARGTTGGTSK